jgi:hypothetical protein
MFRFTIRELVLLTLVVALGFGWWISDRLLHQEWRKLQNENWLLRSEVTKMRYSSSRH